MYVRSSTTDRDTQRCEFIDSLIRLVVRYNFVQMEILYLIMFVFIKNLNLSAYVIIIKRYVRL